MIYKFRIVSDEVTNFKREIEIDAYSTFLDLKNAICECTGFDKNQMCSFFICEDDWEKGKEITLEDMGFDSDEDAMLMEDCELSDYLEDEGQRLIFTFDYMTDRSLFMELRDIITGRDLKDPVCTLAIGQAPAQSIDIEEYTRKIDETAAKAAAVDDLDLDDDIYGADDFDMDELDSDGFSNIDEMNL